MKLIAALLISATTAFPLPDAKATDIRRPFKVAAALSLRKILCGISYDDAVMGALVLQGMKQSMMSLPEAMGYMAGVQDILGDSIRDNHRLAEFCSTPT